MHFIKIGGLYLCVVHVVESLVDQLQEAKAAKLKKVKKLKD